MIYIECFECRTLAPRATPEQAECGYCGSVDIQFLSDETLNARDLPDPANDAD